MECYDIQQYLPFLGDDSIPHEIEQEVMNHLAGCGSCSSEYDRIRHTLSLVQHAYSGTSDVDLIDSVRSGIAHHKRELQFSRFVFSAAAVLLLAVSVYFTLGLQKRQYNGYDVAESVADSDEYYNYLADQYLSIYDMLTVADQIPINDEFDLNSEMVLESGYVDLSVHDIMEDMGAEQFGELLQEMYY